MLHPVQRAWIEEQVPQCGFCQNGQIMNAKVLLDRNPNPTDAQIREGMNGTLCRCMTYYRVHAAIKRAAVSAESGRARVGQGRCGMTTSRRSEQFEELAGAGISHFLVEPVGAAGPGRSRSPLDVDAQAPGPYPDPDFRQLDSWIVIHENNTATFFVGKTDCGQGTGTAFRQMMSDELDIAYDKTTCIMGSTDNTVDQGGSGGSDAIQTDGWPMRRVAAEARRVLLEMASDAFWRPRRSLAVSEAVITVNADPSKSVTYGELIGGKQFHVALTGSNIDATTGVAKVKPVQELKIVGQSPQRYDIPAKVDGSLKWAVDVKLPGMVHARNVKPPVAGATLVSIDESSVRSLPGFVKVVSKGNYVAVVCEREEQAIKAARQLKVNWQKPADVAVPDIGRPLHVHAQRDADVERSGPSSRAARTRRWRRREGRRSRIRCAVSGAHGDRARARDGRSVERSDDDLFERHEVLRDAKRRRPVSRHPARTGARRLDGRAAGLRAHGRGRRGLRGGVSREGDRPAGSRAVDEERRNGVGYQGPGIHLQDARRSRCAGQSHRARLQRPEPPITVTSATTRPTPC